MADKRVVVTLASGSSQRTFALTGPRMQEYAKRVNADFLVLQHTQREPPHFGKFEVLTAARAAYDPILFLDADIWIREQAPDIFDEVTYIDAAAFNEAAHHPRPKWLRRQMDWALARYQAYNVACYYNTGVMLFAAPALWEIRSTLTQSVSKEITGPFFEQDALNVAVQKAELCVDSLDQKWNQFCGPRWFTAEKAAATYFLHGNIYARGDGQRRFDRFSEIISQYP